MVLLFRGQTATRVDRPFESKIPSQSLGTCHELLIFFFLNFSLGRYEHIEDASYCVSYLIKIVPGISSCLNYVILYIFVLDFVLLWPRLESSLQINRARECFSTHFAPNARIGVDSSSSHSSIGRSLKQTENRSGEIVTPGFPFKLGSSAPFGSTTSNWCISVEKNKKSSNLARVLPRHIRLPTPKAVMNESKLVKI